MRPLMEPVFEVAATLGMTFFRMKTTVFISLAIADSFYAVSNVFARGSSWFRACRHNSGRITSAEP